MTRTFKNLDGLFKYVEKNLRLTLNDVALLVEKEMKEYIMKKLYQSYNPKEYHRSYDYINSLTVGKVVQVGTSFNVEVYFDPKKIKQEEVHDSAWNRHMSVDGNTEWNGTPINELIPYFIEYGTNGSLWDREGINVTTETIRELEDTKKHLEVIKNVLKQRGINVKIV